MNPGGASTTTTTGYLNLIDLTGAVKSKFRAHGGTKDGTELSGIVRDVAMLGSAGGPDGWRAVSVGYDGRIQISK